MIFARRTQAALPVVTAAADSRSLNQAGAGQDDDDPAWSTLATDQPHISTTQQPTGAPRGHGDANATNLDVWQSRRNQGACRRLYIERQVHASCPTPRGTSKCHS